MSDHKSFSEDDFSDVDSIRTMNSPSAKTMFSTISASVTANIYHFDPHVNNSPEDCTKSTTVNEPTENLLKTKNVNLNDLDMTIVQSRSIDNIDAKMNSTNPTKENEQVRQPQKALVTEVRPQYSTASLIHSNMYKLDEYGEDSELDQLNLSHNSSSSSGGSKKHSTLPARLNPPVAGFSLNLRSPTSPPPQFPAIGENEINEQHQNYTVVRSGEIIEKNGTYYSSDGTVRGYSGTVKKIANSKTLNEIFEKHKELEQQHEREYELELQKKIKLNEKSPAQSLLKPSQTQVFNPPHLVEKQLTQPASNNNQQPQQPVVGQRVQSQPSQPVNSYTRNNLRNTLGIF